MIYLKPNSSLPMANQVLKSINEGKRVGQKRENLTLGYNTITKRKNTTTTMPSTSGPITMSKHPAVAAAAAAVMMMVVYF